MTMKLNLGCGNDIRQTGYVNVDIRSNDKLPTEIYRQGDIQSLDWLCENNMVEEILALNVLSYIQMPNIRSTIAGWSDKLIENGTLKMSVIDIYGIAKMFSNGQMSSRDFVLAMFGTQNNDDCCRSAIDINDLCALLEESGLTITTKRYDGLFLFVEAVKGTGY